MFKIKNASIIENNKIKKNVEIYYENGKIVDVVFLGKKVGAGNGGQNLNINEQNIIDAKGCVVAPGFIDVQVNGGGGLFFHEVKNKDDIKKITDAHLRFGTTSMCATFITNDFNKIKPCVNLIQSACAQKNLGILGIHFEGPFISKEKKGIHSEKFIKKINNSDIKFLSSVMAPVKIMTAAPEQLSDSVLKNLISSDYKMFIGHSNATFKRSQEAFNLGFIGVTHLFNACSPISAREAGVTGAVLLNENVWAGIIVDGYHVSNETLEIAFKLKQSSKFFLVSDAMSTVGSKLKEFKLFGTHIKLKNNKLSDKKGTLAGAHITMLEAFQNVVRSKLLSFEEAVDLIARNQAECLKLKSKGIIAPGYDSEFVFLDADTLELKNVVK